MKLWAKKSIIWATIIITGVLIDAILSLNIYFASPEYFIGRESNQEIVRMVTDGAIPFVFLMAYIMVIMWICTIFYLTHNKNAVGTDIFYVRICELLVWGLAIFYLGSSITAGSSWYTNNLYELHYTFKSLTTIATISIVIALLFTIINNLFDRMPIRKLEPQEAE